MLVEELERIILNQGKIITALTLRVSALETLLVSQNILTEKDIVSKSSELGQEFVNKVKIAVEKQQNNISSSNTN